MSVDPNVWVALISGTVALFATLTPILTAVIQNHMVVEKEKRDYARQDLIAVRQKGIESQVNQIHTLVNSNLTTEMEAKLAAISALIPLIEENIALNKAAGKEPTLALLNMLDSTKRVVAAQGDALRKRIDMTEKVVQDQVIKDVQP